MDSHGTVGGGGGGSSSSSSTKTTQFPTGSLELTLSAPVVRGCSTSVCICAGDHAAHANQNAVQLSSSCSSAAFRNPNQRPSHSQVRRLPVPAPTQPEATLATQAELDAAVAALADKKRRLRDAFDRLVACSPVPVPFRWEDLDAHLASVAAAAAAAAGAAGGSGHHVRRLDEEERGRERRVVGRGASEEGQGSSNAGGGDASLCQGRGEAEVREAPRARPGRGPDEAGNGRVEEVVASIEASLEQQEDEGAIAAPRPHQSDDDIGMTEEEEEEEAVDVIADKGGRDGEAEEGEWRHPPRAAGPAVAGGDTTALAGAIAAACADMDPSTLVDVLCLRNRGSLRARRAFLPALLAAPDPHALLVRAVGAFLESPGRGASRCWANCVALIECATRLAAPSAGALAQAKRLAGHWKETVVGANAWPAGSRRDMSPMAGWGLLTFIASYNFGPEFDADEIIRLFANLAPQVKDNCVELCRRLGLIEKMIDSINHFIENGQPLDAIRLAHTFSLTDKYPPLTIMRDYVENAKKTAEDILSKESYTLESLNKAMAKKVDALIFSWSAIDGCNIDSVHRKNIKAEITQLLHKYANKQQSLAGVSASTSSSHQQHNFQDYQQRPKMQLVEEQQQQQMSYELQQKPEVKQHQQQKPQEVQHQRIQNQHEPQEREQRSMWQNQKGRRQNKNRKRKQRRQKLQQLTERPRLSPYGRPGINNLHEQPFSGIRRAPFVACTRPRYFGPYDLSQPHMPVFRHH